MNHYSSLQSVASFWYRYFRLISFFGVTLIHVASSGLLYWSIHAREEVVILRYNAYLGIDLLGVWWQLFIVPAVSYFFVLVNTLLIEFLNRRGYDKLTFLLVWGNWFIAGALVVATLALSFINV